jgi:1-aminocyclopropane-1-carboxylate deaminase
LSEKLKLLHYSSTPVHEITDPLLTHAGVRLLIKREDLNHPLVSGNKWWKLKYNLQEAITQRKETLLTFGGAYSNHLYATAAAAHELGLKSIGIVRGEETLPLNDTLTFVREQGMDLHYVSREQYRKKYQPAFLNELKEKFGVHYLIPEGGTNSLAVQGCIEFAQTLLSVPFDHLMLPVGTGGTIAGIISGLPRDKNIVGVSVLKGDFLRVDVQNLLDKKNSDIGYANWTILTSYHHGGYGKVTPELLNFMKRMSVEYNLPLDPVYTGKLLWAVMEEVKQGSFARGSTILAVHTGGTRQQISVLKSKA